MVLRVKPLLNEEVELGRQPSRPRGLFSMVHEVTARRSLQRGVHEEYDKESLRVVTSHRITGRSQRGRDKGGEDEVRLIMRLRCGTTVERGYIEEGVQTRCDKGKGKEMDRHLNV